MESCFPPLASLSLRSSSSANSSAANGKHQKNYRHSVGGGASSGNSGACVATSTGNTSAGAATAAGEQNHNAYLPKLDVIEDLDLYYIRQIACSLKVSKLVMRKMLLKMKKKEN